MLHPIKATLLKTSRA